MISMSRMRPLPAKIVNHSDGMGVPSPELLRGRAEELARIDGRSRVGEQDWKQARRELHGRHSFDAEEGGEEMAQSVSERDMIAGSRGHHTGKIGFDDGENVGEELIAEGMDEAFHDQMLEACKEAEREEEG